MSKVFVIGLAGVMLAGSGAVLSEAAIEVRSAPTLENAGRVVVSGRANIFGAGYKAPPAPGGGGAGVLPPAWRLPAGSERVVTFPRITGRVNPIRTNPDVPWNGPEGDLLGPTDVKSFRGISGIVHRRNGMFLVGVFLTNAEPSQPAPPRLNFTNREQFDVLEPRIGQTFFIGDGKGRRYLVPAGATRLFLGFADGYYYKGPPGWYDNNAGKVVATVRAETAS